jgi:NHLM bacteriocin system ABC transporter ATP-binding protein
MNEPSLSSMQDAIASVEPLVSRGAERIMLDGRHPLLLDRRGRAMQVVSGHVDVFALGVADGQPGTARHHIFRIAAGEVFADVLDAADASDIRVIAVGGNGAEALVTRCSDCGDEVLEAWLAKLSKMIAGPNPSWDIQEASPLSAVEMKPDERRRGPARNIVWLSVAGGSALLMGREPAYRPGTPPVPLSSGMWIAAGPAACVLGDGGRPTGSALWQAVDHFHRCAAACIRERLQIAANLDGQRLIRRNELTRSRAMDMFDRLSAIVIRPAAQAQAVVDISDPLLAACRTATESLKVTISAPAGRLPTWQAFSDIVEIARASRLRVRRIQLRRDWWKHDVGPLVGWHGARRDPVALVRHSGRYIMIGAQAGGQCPVNSAVALELDPEAATFYPTLPSSALKLRDLLTFSLQYVRTDVMRIALAVSLIGLLSMVTPLVTQALVNSVIPRTELNQLGFCAFALVAAAIGMAGGQLMEGTAMLRLEGVVDWRLQAAVIDRLLKLPASLFREYTVGDFVARALGIDAVRRILTGQTLRSLMAGLFCLFSIFLMLTYDPRLALIALALISIRALLIIGTSALRVYHESRQFNLQGKVEGFVLQLLAGVGKLRVAAATVRAMAVWSRQFAAQKRHAIGSQLAANVLTVFESAYPTAATLVVFAFAAWTQSSLIRDLGAFLAFLAAFGQSMAGIGMWANGISASLITIPYIIRIRPLVTADAEISDERKPPGELTGAVEFSRVTFRYVPGGPPVVDNVSLRIAPGEYVAIIGPSGSGKSSLFRLLLGFEKVESGAVFFDGKALDTLDVSAVRRQLGVVLQNGRLATGSIYENICGGLPLPLEQAWAAARMAGLDDDIRKMPMGMHTALAEGVNTLSGGQRQRIMIARAVARRPRILLFDEATSSLDNRSQAVVSDSLGALNVTRIVIAHRLSTVREADRIVVLAEGKVMQTGTFAELSKTEGMFADFARRQLL